MKKLKKGIKAKNKCIVYLHINKDTEEVFYVGIGQSEQRAYDKRNRSTFWKSYIEKYKYDVKIVHKGLTWEAACTLEKKYIEQFGRRDLNEGTLVNMTAGGDGTIGRKDSIQRIKEKRTFMLLNNPMNSPENREKVSKSKKGTKRKDMKGANNPMHKPGVIEKKVESYKNFYYHTKEGEEYQKRKKELYSRTLARPDVREKALKTYKENLSKLTKRERQIKTATMNKKDHKCQYCGILTNKGNYTRWHGEKCKNR